MSSRVRILYYNPNFPGVHLGNHALKALEKSYSYTPGQLVWRSATTNADRSNPNLRRRETNDGRYIYEVPEAAPVIVPIPADLKGIERALFIWAHYPDNFKKGAIFQIWRESRSRCWARQQANPWNHGLGKPRPKKKRLQSRSAADRSISALLAARPTAAQPRRVLAEPPDHERDVPEEAPRLRVGIWA